MEFYWIDCDEAMKYTYFDSCALLSLQKSERNIKAMDDERLKT